MLGCGGGAKVLLLGKAFEAEGWVLAQKSPLQRCAAGFLKLKTIFYEI